MRGVRMPHDQEPRRSTGTIASSSATASRSRWWRPGTGRRAACSIATRRCGRASCWRRRRAKIYVVCDSGYGNGWHFRRVAEKHGPLRMAMLPIGAYEPRWFMRDQHMNPDDAVKALADCGAQAGARRIITARFSSPTRRSTRRQRRWPKRSMRRRFGEGSGKILGAEAGTGVGDLSLPLLHRSSPRTQRVL